MNKLMNKSFWIILSISIITLVGLAIGVIVLTKDLQKEFYSAGYIIDTTTSKSDKYYFDDNTTYKENIFDEYVFKNKENKEVSSSKENFIHYTDGALSFMQKGVILDLDKFNKNMVPYYNITDKSIIKYNNGNYYIETSDKTLVFDNFLGKITDNKYIIVGSNVSIKLAGSDKIVKGKYFEFIFVEDGIVKIVNEESDYQTVAEGTIIYAGDDIKINLGDKSVINGDEVKLSLNEMTIDGDENIDIEPSTGKVDKSSNGKNGTGEESTDNGTSNNNSEATNDNNETSTDDTTGEGTVKSVLKKEVTIDLLNAEAKINSISAKFQVIDTGNYIKGDLIVTLQNITQEEENRTDELVVNAGEPQPVNFSDLTPNCNYLMTITDKNDVSETQYFRRVFKTQSIGNVNVKLEMADTNSLEYVIEFNNDKIKSGEITLTANGESITKTVINQGTYSYVTIDGLESNTKYDVSFGNIVYSNANVSNVKDTNIFNVGSNKTLKKAPTLSSASVIEDEEKKIARLVVESPNDIDGSITKYTYKIYKKITIKSEGETTETNYELAYEFDRMRSQLEMKTIEENGKEYKVIADNEEKLVVNNKNILSNTEYVYKVVAEYYDNYKYGEIETNESRIFTIPKDDTAKVTFTPAKDEEGNDKISFNEIEGTIKITDKACSIPNSDRECNDKENTFIVKYKSSDSNESTFLKNVKFEEKESGSNILEYDLKLNGLSENTTYFFEVYADAYSGEELVTGKYIGSFIVTTKGMETLKMQNWNQNDYSYDIPISVSTEITSTVADSNLINKLSSVTYKLYRGKKAEGEPIGSYTVTGDDIVKNKAYNITSKDFGIENLDELREISGGKINDNYTIEVTDAYDESHVNIITIENNTFLYSTPPLLILEDDVSDIKIVVDEITNEQTKTGNYDISYDSNLNKDTIVGYKVTASIIDMPKVTSRYTPMKINFYAYNNKNKLIETKNIDIAYDQAGTVINEYETYFFLKNGTDYNTEDKELRRGNGYIFAFDISIDTNNDAEEDTNFPSGKVKNIIKISSKQNPTFKMYIDSSTENSITYKYTIKDIDNAFYKDEEDGERYLYYTIADDNENEYKTKLEEDTFTIQNLSNNSIYNINYYRANNKISNPSKVKYNSYYFDGLYNIENFNYNLEYGNFDNRLKIILDNNELMNRVSAYLITLSTGSDKYQKVFAQSQLSDCDENKCIIIDYADISSLKGKNITTSVEAFYDTGYTGLSMKSNLGAYFTGLGLIDEDKKSNVGYVYQNNSISGPGKYYYVASNENPDSTKLANIFIDSNYPNGILVAEISETNNKNQFKLNTNNLVDFYNQKLVPYGEIFVNNVTLINKEDPDGLTVSEKNFVLNLKVLDKTSLITDNNSFKFTSITPKVTSTVSPTINGAVINVDLSIDSDTLEQDFVKTDDKYKFYIDIYQKNECTEEENCTDTLIDTIPADYESISEITFDGLLPATSYYYKISADMNKNGKTVKTPLFDYHKSGYVEYKNNFSTLDKNDIFSKVSYQYSSTSNKEDKIYKIRQLTTKLTTKTNVNFDVKFEIYDSKDNLEYEYIIPNEEIQTNKNVFLATYIQDISSDNFVFGPEYHKLKITAITTDSKHNSLELYNDTLKNDSFSGWNFPELSSPTIEVTPTAIIEDNGGEYKHSINVNIVVKDTDKVIKNGKLYIELQEATTSEGYINACKGHEEDCKTTIDYFANNGFEINKKFTDLIPDTSYIIYVYADTYRNNISLNEEEKDSVVYVRKNQYTKNELGFSLGLVTPTATSKDNLVITFTGSSNLTNSITGIEYSINIQGGEKVASGKKGKISNDDTDDNITFIGSSEPSLKITMPDGKQLGKNNYILLTYYYKDNNGNIKALELNGKTVNSYGVVYNGS